MSESPKTKPSTKKKTLHTPDIKFRNAKPRDMPYKIGDELGLFMLVSPAGGRGWKFKYRFEGKEKKLRFGSYPEVSLEQARKKRDDARCVIADGKDPAAIAAEIVEVKKQAIEAQAAVDEKAALTFEVIALEWHAYTKHLWSDSHAYKLMQRLYNHIFPVIGSVPVGEVKAKHVLDCCAKPIAANNLVTAQGVKVTCGQVMKYAVKLGHAQFNPTSVLTAADVPQPIERNMPAMETPADFARLVKAVRDYPYPVVRTAHLLMMLTFQRGINIRTMKWAHIDFEQALWTIPSEEMKRTLRDKEAGQPHIVPLVPQVVAAIEALRPLSGGERYVLPSPRSKDEPLSNMAMNAALRYMGFPKGEVTSHGYRATAKTLLKEEFDIADELIEAQQAHKVKDTLGTSYNRTRFIARRRKMLETWADYVDSLAVANVLPFKKAG